MNLEVYKPKTPEQELPKTSEQELPKTPEQEQPKTPEQKSDSLERQKELETKQVIRLCAQYHERLDSSGNYFSSEAAKVAESLLPGFRKIDLQKLPLCLQNVIRHRTIYLELIIALSRNKRLIGLIDKYKPTVFNPGVFSNDVKNIKNSAEYKQLTAEDFKSAREIVNLALTQLQVLNKISGDWGKEAREILLTGPVRDSRVDDNEAAMNLATGLQIVNDNLL